jgi:hypothetical protein
MQAVMSRNVTSDGSANTLPPQGPYDTVTVSPVTLAKISDDPWHLLTAPRARTNRLQRDSIFIARGKSVLRQAEPFEPRCNRGKVAFSVHNTLRL